jgi:hypothetical protein
LPTWPALASLLHRLLEIVCQTPPAQLIASGENQLIAAKHVEDQQASSPRAADQLIGWPRAEDQLIGWPRAEDQLTGKVPDVGNQLTDLFRDIVLLVNSESVREDDREDNILMNLKYI